MKRYTEVAIESPVGMISESSDLLQMNNFCFIPHRSVRLHIVLHWNWGSQLTKYHTRWILRWVCFSSCHQFLNEEFISDVFYKMSYTDFRNEWSRTLSSKRSRFVITKVICQTSQCVFLLWCTFSKSRGHLYFGWHSRHTVSLWVVKCCLQQKCGWTYSTQKWVWF